MTDGVPLAEAVERLHPEPFHCVTRERFFGEAERAETLTELMQLLALLGDRNGHTGVHPLDDHTRPLHAFPIVPYEFDDGVFVVAAETPELIGSQLLAVDGHPVDELNEALAPLVARDNEWTVRARRPVFSATAEVLRELGIVGEARVTLRLRGREAQLDQITASEYRARFGTGDRLPPHRHDRRIESVDGARAVHVGYDVTRGDTTEFARAIEAAAAQADQVVLDLRRNGGGNNQTYGPLLDALERLTTRGKRLAVLTSRVTFSAAMQLVVDLEQRTPAVFVGEPTGGSPNQFGDAEPVELPATGLTARVATVSWTTAGEGDERLTREPDVFVPLTSDAYFAGDDPVLDAALAQR
jgi:hypothetical protein